MALRTIAEARPEPAHRPSPGARRDPRVSVVVPVADRADDLVEVYRAYAAELDRHEPASEFLFVFDGSFGAPPAALLACVQNDPRLRILELAHSFGETGALRAGFAESRGEVIVTLPAYFQVEPAVVGALLSRLASGGDLVVARRHPREDGWFNRLQSRGFHGLVHALTGTRFADTACGARAMRRSVAESLTLYGDLHRFIPALAQRQGFEVAEIKTRQHRADARTRVYRPGTYVRRILDIIALFFLLKFTEKPLRFFGLVGGVFASVGGAVCVVLAFQRLTGTGIANRPLLLLGVLLIALGVQITALGLVGEIVVHWLVGERRTYRVRRLV